MNIELPDFIQHLFEGAVPITLVDVKDGRTLLDLNLNAKSHMYLYKGPADTWRVAMRYDEDYLVENLGDVLRYAEYGKHGNSYIHPAWAALLEKYKGKY